MTNIAGSTGAAAATLPALIVLGLDDGGKAHASWFGGAEVGIAEKAAGMMGMAALPIADASALHELAGRLPQGRVFESGRAFVPFVKRTLYDAIATHLPPGYQFPVRAADDRPPPAKPKKKASAASAPESGPTRPEPHRPTDWEKIEVGSLVLATMGPYEGWYEATVTKVSPEGLCTLRWRDWLEEPAFTRKLKDLALLHPDHRD
ncbi:tudor domain-containing protein [Mesorhizobium sp. M0028]|uniref:tudor domain-containing protein n=1 Tax=unclassified Mesorhizobium TaxID=325217 RepID=UPI00333903CF